MGLDELSVAQQELLHPLIKLKRKTSQESLGSLAELVSDISRLYTEFADGIHQLELKANNFSFLTGVSNFSSSEALRQIRGDIPCSDDTVHLITKEQKGLSAVWMAIFRLLSLTRKDASQFASLLTQSVCDPLMVLCDEFNDGFNEPVDQLEMNDVLNFIPNLKTLRLTPAFHHCGARKYVENVLKAYKDLQHSLENEKEVVGDAVGINDGKSQAKAVNKTVKAKMSLGKHIQQLFEQAPAMKVLISKGVSQDVIEQLATLKLKKTPHTIGEIQSNPVDFHTRFCSLEKRRLSMFSSCLQILVEALVNYERDSYNNLRELYQAIVEFSPEADYGQLEALILGARVSHTARHSRIFDDKWLPKGFGELEKFKVGKQSSTSPILHQPTAIGDFNDDSETVVDAPIISPSDGDIRRQVSMSVGDIDASISGAEGSSKPSKLQSSNGLESHITPDTLRTPMTGTSDALEQLGTLTDRSTDGVTNGTAVLSSHSNLEGSVTVDHVPIAKWDVYPDGVMQPANESHLPSTQIVPSVRLAGENGKGSGLVIRQSNVIGRNHGDCETSRDCSIGKVVTSQVDNMYECVLRCGRDNKGDPAIRRSSSALPCDVRNLSIPLYKDVKRDKKKDEYSENKDNHNSEQLGSEKKRGNKKYKDTDFALPNMKNDNETVTNNPEEPFKGGITFDFETFKTAREVLLATLRRSDSYFLGLYRDYNMQIKKPFNTFVDEINPLLEDGQFTFPYPFELSSHMTAKSSNGKLFQSSAPELFSDTTSTYMEASDSIGNEYNANIRRIMQLPYKFDGSMDMCQWNIFALESLLLLHKHLSSFLTHSSLSNDANSTMKDFLLRNLGIIEHLVTRIRNFIEVFRNRINISRQHFAVLDLVLTPRNSFVNTSPNIRIHPMDVRYRILLLIDSLYKNDVALGNGILFDLTDFHNFLHRQLCVIKLSFTQKLARVIRRIPVLDGDLDSRWRRALESVDPVTILDLKFTFKDSADVEQITNQILLLLCECIGRLNNVQRVLEQGQWGKDIVCDSNYTSTHDQLIQLVKRTVELEDLDNTLMGLLGMPENSQFASTLNGSCYTYASNPVDAPHGYEACKPCLESTFPERGNSFGFLYGGRDTPKALKVPISDADAFFCTSMSIFDDEDISVLKRVSGRRGCFNRCISRRSSRHIDMEDTVINPYFLCSMEAIKLSRCWKLDDWIILRIASCYHCCFAENLAFSDWSTNFTTIEYVLYFISTGSLLNFRLFKEPHNEGYTNICTLFNALLSVCAMHNRCSEAPTYPSTESYFREETSNNGRVDNGGSIEHNLYKDVFTLLQVPHNVAVLPKVLGDVDLYLTIDMREAASCFKKVHNTYGVPPYSSLQHSDLLSTENLNDRFSATKVQIAGMQLNRAGYKVYRLVLDSICYNIPMMTTLRCRDSMSLVNSSSCEQLVTSVLVLRVLTQKFRRIVLEQLLHFNAEEGVKTLSYKLSTFVLINRLLFRNELEMNPSDGGPLDSHSLLEANRGGLSMDSILRRVVFEHAKSVVVASFARLDAFKIDDIDTLGATCIDNIVVTIKEYLIFAAVWDDFLPSGDFATLFTNSCIHFIKLEIQKRTSRLLDVCKVMPSVQKLRLLQREVETSRLIKTNGETQQNDLLKVLQFSFKHTGALGRELLAEHCDIMEIIGMSELNKRLGTFKDIVTRGMKNEDWKRLGSQYHTRAVVDMATVLNATLNATLSLRVPLENLLVPLTSSLESVLNHYLITVAGAKVAETVDQALSALRNESGSAVEIVKKLGNDGDIDKTLLQMGNVLYLGNYLTNCQDSILQYYHAMLTERCDGSDEIHRHLSTDVYRDSSKFFSFDFESFLAMKELALVPASKRLIQRQCEYHLQTLARLCGLKALHPISEQLYQPTVAQGNRFPQFLDLIEDELSKLLDVLTTNSIRSVQLDEGLNVDGYLWNFTVLRLQQADYNGNLLSDIAAWQFYRERGRLETASSTHVRDLFIYNVMRDLPRIVFCRNKKKFFREFGSTSHLQIPEIRHQLVLEKTRPSLLHVTSVDAAPRASNNEQLVIGILGVDRKGDISIKGTLSQLRLVITPDTVIEHGIYCHSCTVIVRGVMDSYKDAIRCIEIRHPPPMVKTEIPDFFGGNISLTDQCVFESRMSLLKEGGGSERWVVIADLHLDVKGAVDSFEMLLDTFLDMYQSQGFPAGFILMGNFMSSGFNVAGSIPEKYNQGFERLQMLLLKAKFRVLLMTSYFVFLPGQGDATACSSLMPIPPLLREFTSHFTDRMKSHLGDHAKIVYATNPCRVRHLTKRMLFCRSDLLNKLLCSSLLTSGTVQNKTSPSDLKRMLVTTILGQGHLCPNRPGYSTIVKHDAALLLYPMPDLICIGIGLDCGGARVPG
ncbi:DNA polymerase epsilon subunit 2 [Babesia ovata]|uniref:DNA polymerase II subunit 2 n=1 Tax=Babesia ovata TaxID=189622 RepID=A0A2H6KER7_9APIC|nr:DNA polymerase epsilon subunit 2 [Babesia ovata]GBE61449.1 DNA polymerase epsilon subunit 2 [Babesia ovata]